MKMKVKASMFLVVLLCTAAVYGSNLITNGGFESGIWTSDKTGVWDRSSDAVEGSYSLHTTSTTTKRECSSGLISVNPDAVYRLSAWIKTSEIDLANGVEIRILQCNSSNQAIGWLGGSTMITTGGHKGWRRYEYTVDNLSSACTAIKIYLKLNAGSGGEVLFDDIQFSSVSKLTNFHLDQSAWTYETGGGGWSWSSVNPHNGAGCMYSESNPSVTRYNSTPPIPVDPSQRYSLSAFIKTSGVVADHGVEVRILQCNSSNQAIGWYSPPDSGQVFVFGQSGTMNYTGHSLDNIKFNANTTNVKVYVRHLRDAGGTAFIDDIQLVAAHRDNYDWGVSAHSSAISSAYKASNLEECMALAGGLGANLYRVDFSLVKDAGGSIIWAWSDAVVNEAYDQGRKIYAILYCNAANSYQDIYNDTYAFAQRYKGKIDYYQLANEVDCSVILGPQYDGMSTSHYNMVSYAVWETALDAMSNAVHAADPDVKRVINIGWKHVGFLELLAAGGVEWEVNGLDWYWGDTSNLTETVDAMLAMGKELIVAESNINDGTYNNTEQESADMIVEHALFFYNHSSPLIKGFVVYELLDEILHPIPSQKYYGIYNSDGNGTIGSIKLGGIAYGDFISARE